MPEKEENTLLTRELVASMVQEELAKKNDELAAARKALLDDGTDYESVPASTVSASESPAGMTFADLLTQNEAFRQKQGENFAKREKEMRSRKTLAAVSDALSSLGNLVGTTQGAFSQQQTYQMPFLTQEAEADRALARNAAERLRLSDYNILAAQAKQGSVVDPITLENLKHKHALRQIDLRGLYQMGAQDAITARNNASIESRNRNTDLNNETRIKTTQMNNATSRANTTDNNATRKEIAEMRKDGGGVGGYTTQTVIEYDELGRKVGETKRRTGSDGATTTTTTTKSGTTTTVQTDNGTTTTTQPATKSGSAAKSAAKPAGSTKKANPMGAQAANNGNKKKKNPMS